jgi:hypothetical protein
MPWGHSGANVPECPQISRQRRTTVNGFTAIYEKFWVLYLWILPWIPLFWFIDKVDKQSEFSFDVLKELDLLGLSFFGVLILLGWGTGTRIGKGQQQ